MNNILDILESVATRLGKRTKPCNCFDPMVCEITVGNRWEPVAKSGSPFTRELRTDYNQGRINLMANPEFLRCEMKGSLSVVHAYSIGQPGLACFAKSPQAWLETTRSVRKSSTRSSGIAALAMRLESLGQP